jgi:thiol:disulfide interchange protein
MRRNWFVLGLLVAVVFLQSFMLKSDEKIQFRDASWNEIGKDAKSEEKLIFVMVTASWCPVCKRMEKTLSDTKVGEFYNEKFVSTRFDSDNTMQNMRATNWGMAKVPGMIFLDQKKHVIHTASGFKDAAGMLKEAQIALDKMK